MIKKYQKDLILITTIVIICILAIICIKLNQKTGTNVNVIYNNQITNTYQLNKNQEIQITYDQNYNILVIQDGYAYIKDASCKDHICVKHQKIKNIGETIICLPNKIIIKIT